MTSSVAGPRRSSKALPKASSVQSLSRVWLSRVPKPNLHQKKVLVTVRCSAAHLIHYNFLNPGETITSEMYAQQIIEMYWKLQHLQPASVNRKGPILHDDAWLHVTHSTLQKLNELGYKVLPHPPYSPDLSPTNYHFFKHLNNFLQEKHNQWDAENAFQEFIQSQNIDFYSIGINKHFSLAKNVLILMVPILINKNVLEPSYNEIHGLKP